MGKRMRVLFYYWDPIDGPAGGGVTAYLKEIIANLLERKDIEIYYLNSGRKYDDSGKLSINATKNIFSSRVKSFEIVNCPVLSPSKQSIINVKKYLEDERVKASLKSFITENGPFDIIHFHSLEGLPVNVLELKDDFPKTRFLYSFHNYCPLCTQVNMWKKDERNCDFVDFGDCASCYEKENYNLALYRFKHLDIKGLKQQNLEISNKEPDKGEVSVYRDYYYKNRDYFNKYFDKMLAVSYRTRDVLIEHGYDKSKFIVSYVGTEVAKRAIHSSNCRAYMPNGTLRIVYVGYPRKDKGFFFVLDALEQMENEFAKKIEITLVARHLDNENLGRVERLNRKMAKVNVYDGFKDYDDLEEILSEQDIGVVPVLWEDNLPRVAIEQIALGIPILTSNLGGASELFGKEQPFVFVAGEKDSFIGKLRDIYNDPGLLKNFCEHTKHLVTVDEHCKNLIDLYGEK